jgi:hypothetical protein
VSNLEPETIWISLKTAGVAIFLYFSVGSVASIGWLAISGAFYAIMALNGIIHLERQNSENSSFLDE